MAVTLLIDADILTYRMGYAAQKTMFRFVFNSGAHFDFPPGYTLLRVKKLLKKKRITMAHGKLQKHLKVKPMAFVSMWIEKLVSDLKTKFKTDKLQFFLTSDDKSNYRYEVAKTKPYKGNRTQPRPKLYKEIRTFLSERFDAKIIDGEEADDAMGIAMSQNKKAIIVTIDKDLKMVPGYCYNYVTDTLHKVRDPGILTLSQDGRKLEGTGIKWFYAQMLLGDSCDNIPGIRGWGPVRVHHALVDSENEIQMLKIVYNIYKKELKLDDYNTEIRIKEIADLLWIRREPNEVKSKHLETLLGEINV